MIAISDLRNWTGSSNWAYCNQLLIGVCSGNYKATPCVQFAFGNLSMLEELLEPGSTALPTCRCGSEMAFVKSEDRSKDVLVKFYTCGTCAQEIRLMLWRDAGSATQNLVINSLECTGM